MKKLFILILILLPFTIQAGGRGAIYPGGAPYEVLHPPIVPDPIPAPVEPAELPPLPICTPAPDPKPDPKPEPDPTPNPEPPPENPLGSIKPVKVSRIKSFVHLIGRFITSIGETFKNY